LALCGRERETDEQKKKGRRRRRELNLVSLNGVRVKCIRYLAWNGGSQNISGRHTRAEGREKQNKGRFEKTESKDGWIHVTLNLETGNLLQICMIPWMCERSVVRLIIIIIIIIIIR
jgi:hypothetical protein